MPNTPTTKEIADKIYKAGYRNGRIDMKSKILKKINRDWSLPVIAAVKIMKIIDKIK